MDPYVDATFFEWFYILFSRIFSFRVTELFPDEIQLCVMGLFASSAGFLGVFLVLKRLTMMANAMSHTMLLGIVIACIIGATFQSGSTGSVTPPDWIIIGASLAIGLLTGFLTQQLASVQLIKEDSSNGMVFSALFALGVTLLSLWSRNSHAGPELLMGDPDALTSSDIPMVLFVACITFLMGLPLLRGFTVAIFDSNFALLSGFRPSLFHHLLLVLVALVTVSAFRAVGFVMTLAFFVIPPLMTRLWAHTLRSLLLWSVAMSVVTVAAAVALGRHLLSVYYLPVSTGALSAVLLAVLYGGALCVHYVMTAQKRAL
jgi:manganese/zinc/iron transport system permease protein